MYKQFENETQKNTYKPPVNLDEYDEKESGKEGYISFMKVVGFTALCIVVLLAVAVYSFVR